VSEPHLGQKRLKSLREVRRTGSSSFDCIRLDIQCSSVHDDPVYFNRCGDDACGIRRDDKIVVQNPEALTNGGEVKELNVGGGAAGLIN